MTLFHRDIGFREAKADEILQTSVRFSGSGVNVYPFGVRKIAQPHA